MEEFSPNQESEEKSTIKMSFWGASFRDFIEMQEKLDEIERTYPITILYSTDSNGKDVSLGIQIEADCKEEAIEVLGEYGFTWYEVD